MRTVVFGKKIQNNYEVDSKRQDVRRNDYTYDTVFTGKPKLIKSTNIIGWEEILSYDGAPRYNKRFDVWSFDYDNNQMNISDDDVVKAEREFFRADLNEVHVQTDKVMSEINLYKEESERDYAELVKLFNKQMIESNDKMKAYCDLHKLNYEETDCIELFKMVYPDNSWEIKDGKMQAESKKSVIAKNDLSWCDIWGKPIISEYGLVKATTLDSKSNKSLNGGDLCR